MEDVSRQDLSIVNDDLDNDIIFNTRVQIFKYLEPCNPSFTYFNPRTLWCVSHWVAHHCDYSAIDYLMENYLEIFRILFFVPDY